MADDKVARLAKLETAVVSDVLDEMGYPGQVLSPALKPLDPTRRMAGRALCARGETRMTTMPAADKLPNIYEIERRMGPGMVSVVDAGGNDVGAILGGFVAISYKNAGGAGIVTNGGVRDSREIVELGLPTYCRFVTPINGSRRFAIVEVGQPVAMPGIGGATIIVRPDDYLLGDGDGAIVIPQEIIDPVLEASEKLDAIERTITEGIRKGGTREQLFPLHPRFKHIPKLR